MTSRNQAPIQLNFNDLIDALETLEDNQEAYRSYTRAQRIVKKYVPVVQEPTKFLVGEDWEINVLPEPRDGYAVQDGITQRRQITRVDGRRGK